MAALTPEQYLELDRKAVVPSEYSNGVLHPVPKSNPRQRLILTNLTKALNAELAMSRCKAMVTPVRIRIPGAPAKYMYPDLIAVCGKCEFEDNSGDTVGNPTILVELPAPSGDSAHQEAKGGWYRSIPTLKAHIIVAQDRVAVTVYTRKKAQDWSLEDLLDVNDVLELESISAKIPLAQIYKRIEFDDGADG